MVYMYEPSIVQIRIPESTCITILKTDHDFKNGFDEIRSFGGLTI
jgi:hypothetical protein